MYVSPLSPRDHDERSDPSNPRNKSLWANLVLLIGTVLLGAGLVSILWR